jgi:hypothetical protein
MPQARSSRPTKRGTTARKRAPARRSSRRDDPLDQLVSSLEAAQKALADLGKSLSSGGKEMLKELQGGVSTARRQAGRLNKTLRTELEQVQQALTGTRKPARGGARRKAGARKATTRKTTPRKAAARKTSRSRTAAARKAAARR